MSLLQDSPFNRPPKGSYGIFEKGMHYILDSFGQYEGYKTVNTRTMRDNEKNRIGHYEHRETPSDYYPNDHKILLHGPNDIPMFHGHKSKQIITNVKNTFRTVFLHEFELQFRTIQRFHDKNLKIYDVSKRLCYFTDEASQLWLTERGYTQNNCILKCKLEKVLKKCKCLPWFSTFRKDVPTCDLFGHKCYEQKMLQINDDLDFTDENNPPCGCFPNCEETEYIPYLDKNGGSNELTVQKNKILLDLEFPDYLLGGSDWLNDDFVQQHGKDKFLLPYLRDIFLGKMD